MTTGIHKAEKWLHKDDSELTDVEHFINDFMTHSAHNSKEREIIHSLFRAGYCYHFAHILLATFNRGRVVWAAPFGHICWQDNDGTAYDIEGEYRGEAFYMIPEDFAESKIPGTMLDFKHIPNKNYNISKSEIIDICKAYCTENGLKYYENIENYLT